MLDECFGAAVKLAIRGQSSVACMRPLQSGVCDGDDANDGRCDDEMACSSQ